MGLHALLVRIHRRAVELRAATAANVTMTFAFAMIPLVGLVGAAVDFSHASSVKVAMQAAVDGTALMLSKQAASLNQTDLQPKADAYFKCAVQPPRSHRRHRQRQLHDGRAAARSSSRRPRP